MKILFVKLSSLGDIVHAMAALQDIRSALPQAQIDWVVERSFGALVRRCGGVHRVIECELRRWRKNPFAGETRRAWRSFRFELQREQYDAVIDLQGLSKSALISWLAQLSPQGRRYGLATQSEGSSFEAPARWVADVAIELPTHIHAVDRSRCLCARALGYEVTRPAEFGLKVATPSGPPARPLVALVHGTSRADKQWPVASWQKLGQCLIEQGYDIALPCGSDAEEQVARQIADGLTQAQVWPRVELDALADALGGCAGVIGVDSGLSHIAVALHLRHVQIYNFDTAWRTGPSGTCLQCSVFASPTPSVDAVWQAWLTTGEERVVP